ncbi:hypothetical protein SLE2022_065860 [Rubroshorea leprosula]
MDDSVPDHKLCGYLCAILSVPEPVPSGTPCHLLTNGPAIGFKSQTGVLLSPLPEGDVSLSPDYNAENSTPGSIRGRKAPRKKMAKGGKKGGKTRRKIGMVNGSLSVVRQIHALVAHKCVKILARVLRVESAGNGETRAVLLVDVYLPIELWSGWQFPRSGSVAGAFFRHLSCDWGKRSSMLVNSGEMDKEAHGSSMDAWNLSDCHVLGCKLHYYGSDSSNGRLFELHEIFKGLPSVTNNGRADSSRVQPAVNTCLTGIWDLADDILINILTGLSPIDLTRMAATCRHLRYLAALVMPCIKLKLFPHQKVAVEWMLKRERNAEILIHPLYTEFTTEDGFSLFVNGVSGHIVTGSAPTIRDFRGGMFCDEPGLGKTITALSLILKTQGTMADPPEGVQVIWCMHNDLRCGYYDVFTNDKMMLGKFRRSPSSLGWFSPLDDVNLSPPKRARLIDPDERSAEFNKSSGNGMKTLSTPCSKPPTLQHSRNLIQIRKNLLYSYNDSSDFCKERKSERNKIVRNGSRDVSGKKQVGLSCSMATRAGRATAGSMCNDNWVQCDACHKWRKVSDTTSLAGSKAAWFCSMNINPAYQRCTDPEEAWDNIEAVTDLPGFYSKGTPRGKEENVSFFVTVLKEHYAAINSRSLKALVWLAQLSPERLSQMETVGLLSPVLGCFVDEDALEFQKIFQAFGLVKRVEKGVSRWYYPSTLHNLAFDLAALRIALYEPLDSVRLYLSRATLIVVPANLVDHWKTQIQKHVRPGQLRLYVWVDHRRPPVHSLAWDYDIVITTFNRLSAEWGPHKKSALMQVHWLRVMLDEGHTLGSSFSLTNKLQMAISLVASNRWLLTGTPTPNTPNSQLSHLQPLLKFLHEEAYGQNHKSWEAGILRPFEAEMEEGRSRLLQLLHRCMISARKIDLQTIPPCIKKVTFLNFTKEHAKSYNELVVTVRRNILMADWNDPSHVESLLNPKQWKFRSTTIRNVRLSCCVAGHIKVADAGEDIQETMDMLAGNGLDPASEEYAFIKYNILYGGNCLRCNEWCRLPIITPCRHLLCLDCVALDSEMCTFPGCGNLYEMQTPETLARPENPNPKWPVPKDLIELQPSYKQDNWNPDWQSTSSSKVSYLIERLKALQEANSKVLCSMVEDNEATHFDKLLCPSQRNDTSLLLLQNCPGMGSESNNTLPEKVIIFSQFLEHIHVIEQQLTFAGVKFAGMYSPMHSSNKMKSLAMFQHDVNCLALLMDGTAALGLDLSFVTHVFLMEPIWDRSMEEQVISRAHRMGATRPIHVETLAMHGTIEEQMLQFLQDADACRKLLKEESQNPDREGARICRTLHDFAENNYLSRLSFVRTNNSKA